MLAKHGLLESLKGRGGGFFFEDNQSDLSLRDVIQVMEGDTCFNKCGIGLKNCDSVYPCPLHDQYEKIRDSFHQLALSEMIHPLSMKVIKGNAVINRLEHSSKTII